MCVQYSKIGRFVVPPQPNNEISGLYGLGHYPVGLFCLQWTHSSAIKIWYCFDWISPNWKCLLGCYCCLHSAKINRGGTNIQRPLISGPTIISSFLTVKKERNPQNNLRQISKQKLLHQQLGRMTIRKL